jgi:hypothetical protein
MKSILLGFKVDNLFPCMFATCRWGEPWEQLQTSFEQHRASWLASDRAGWLALNQPYAGMVEAIAACEYPIYFASR